MRSAYTFSYFTDLISAATRTERSLGMLNKIMMTGRLTSEPALTTDMETIIVDLASKLSDRDIT